MCVCARAHYAYRHTPTFSITETCGWQTDWVGTETEALQPGRHIQRRDAPRTGAEGGSAQVLADEPWPSKRSSTMGQPRGNDQTKDAQADDQKELLQAGSAESGGAVDARASGEKDGRRPQALAFEEGWDDAVEGVSRVFRYPTQVEW